MTELKNRLISIFPLSIDDLTWTPKHYRWPHEGIPELYTLNKDLEYLRFLECSYTNWRECTSNLLYYGVLKGPDQGGLAVAPIPSTVSSGTMIDDPWGENRNTHAHELGHNLGLHHAVHETLGPFPGIPYPHKQGWCWVHVQGQFRPEIDGPDADNFPYSIKLGGQIFATIGPMNSGENQIIYGLDTRLVQDNPDRAVINPYHRFALMSYCNIVSRNWDWISKFNYKNLIENINNEIPEGQDQKTTSSISQYLVVRGEINLNNDTVEFR